jgi:hypothetical protein
MFTYTSLFVASLVVAAVIYFLFRVVSDSSRSVYSSKEPLAIIDSTKVNAKDTTVTKGLASKPTPFGQGGHASPQHVARTNPAVPTDNINWGWEGSGVQLRESQSRPLQGAGESGHCSLYDARMSENKPHFDRHAGRLHREEKFNPAGKTYRVTRKDDHKTPEAGSPNKPWGW